MGYVKYCFKSNVASGRCPSCERFRRSNYGLDRDKRKVKYKDDDNYIVCEKCNQKIDREYHYCTGCYNKGTDIDKRNYMKYGLKIGVFKTSDYDLNMDERRAKYKDNHRIICEKCNQKIDWLYY